MVKNTKINVDPTSISLCNWLDVSIDIARPKAIDHLIDKVHDIIPFWLVLIWKFFNPK